MTFVGAQLHHVRNRQAERLGGLKVDDQLRTIWVRGFAAAPS